MAEAPRKYRVQLDFDEQGFRELEELKTEVRAGSRADTIRYGLGLLQWAARQLKDGSRVLVEHEGELGGVVFPFLAAEQVRLASRPVVLKKTKTAEPATGEIKVDVQPWKPMSGNVFRPYYEREHE